MTRVDRLAVKLRRLEERVAKLTADVVDLQHRRSDLNHRWIRAHRALESVLIERRTVRKWLAEALQADGEKGGGV